MAVYGADQGVLNARGTVGAGPCQLAVLLLLAKSSSHCTSLYVVETEASNRPNTECQKVFTHIHKMNTYRQVCIHDD